VPTRGIEKKAVTEEDMRQFLTVVKMSEFNVVDQLRKILAQISILELIQSSKKHKNTLLNILNEVHVREKIDDIQLREFVGTILLKDQIAFTDEDLPTDEGDHTKALHISVKHNSTVVSRVLIDDGSVLNICPLVTIHYLAVEMEMIRLTKSTVRGLMG